MGIPGPDPIGELPMNTTSEVHGDASIQMFTQLTPNSPYQVTICALTSSGCGTNVAVNQTTHEDGKLVNTVEPRLKNLCITHWIWLCSKPFA